MENNKGNQTYADNRNQQITPKKTPNHAQQNKLSMLISLSLVLAVISIVSLFFVIRTKNNTFRENSNEKETVEEVIEEETEQNTKDESFN
ncbi:hypothetical protein ACFL0C_02210, partial [Patescibacteria group bacterium]